MILWTFYLLFSLGFAGFCTMNVWESIKAPLPAKIVEVAITFFGAFLFWPIWLGAFIAHITDTPWTDKK